MSTWQLEIGTDLTDDMHLAFYLLAKLTYEDFSHGGGEHREKLEIKVKELLKSYGIKDKESLDKHFKNFWGLI